MLSSPGLDSLLSSCRIEDKSNLIKEVITTPYEKVLSILKEIKAFILSVKPHSKQIEQLNWVIEIISSHSLYKYEILNQKENYEDIQKEIPEFQHFVEFLSNSDEQCTRKRNQMLKKTVKLNMDEEGTQKLSRNLVRKKQMTICLPRITLDDKNPPSLFERSSSSNAITHKLLSLEKQSKDNPSTDYIILPHKASNFSVKSISDFVDKGNYNSNGSEQSPCDRLIFDEEDDINSIGIKSDSNNGSLQTTPVIKNGLSFETSDILSYSFDLLSLKDLVGYNSVMPIVGKMIFDYFGLNDMINSKKLDSLLSAISSGYHQNVLYHNALHGTDVAHTVAMFIINSNIEEISYTNVNDILAIITACLGHDLGHPGLNNNFQMNILSDIAITYNDISVLENFHSATLFTILRKNENNIFDSFTNFDFKTLRKRIISHILSTDMMNHGKVLGVVKSKISNGGEIVNKDSTNIFEEQAALLDFMVHASDIGHNAKTFNVSVRWVELLSNEFWIQGDKEKSLKLPVSFLCDRNDVDIPKSQVGFIKAFVIPVYEVVSSMFPSLSVFLDNAKNNVEMWSNLSKEGKKTGFTPEKKKQ